MYDGMVSACCRAALGPAEGQAMTRFVCLGCLEVTSAILGECEHQWMLVVAYRLDDEEMAKYHASPDGDPKDGDDVDPLLVTLTAEKIVGRRTLVGCIVCERSWHAARHTTCPGRPLAYTPGGEAIHV